MCLGHLCNSIQKDPRTVCTPCIETNLWRMEKIFTDGKNIEGLWIDPATKLPVPTCQECDVPFTGGWLCSPVFGCRRAPEHA